MKNFQSDYKLRDEYKEFKEFLENIQKFNSSLFFDLFNSLEENEKNIIKEVVSLQRIELKKKMSLPRKVVKIKRI